MPIYINNEQHYTHEEMVNLCDESKRIILSEFESMIDSLDSDVSGGCVWLSEIKDGISEIIEQNGLKKSRV